MNMASVVMDHFYSCLNLPLVEKISELIRIIDQASPFKDLQTLFPILVSDIFGISTNAQGWGLRTVTLEGNHSEFKSVHAFLEPLGPIFRLCYKLLADPQLKYLLPLNLLPIDLQQILETGRSPHFYADLLNIDTESMGVVALALNSFDYYIFNFALHLLNGNATRFSWEYWDSIYFALACDYLTHFLPSDPNMPVLPHIPNYTGKVPMVAPLQAPNRPLHTPSLLIIPDIISMNTQHSTSQSQLRNEVWRTETVVQVFIDIWMSVEEYNPNVIGAHMYARPFPLQRTSGERVRTTRVLVKQIHSFASVHGADPIPRSSSLRKYARQMMCMKGYRYINHLVTSWPLDASFRLVLELWLSLIQPWRYVGARNMFDERSSSMNFERRNNQDDGSTRAVDPTYTQFIAENFPFYTCIFQLVLPRFLRLELNSPKNAIMLFRLGKVFAQGNLVPILMDIERAVLDGDTTYHSDNSYSPVRSQSFTECSTPNKWGAIAKQALAELNMSPNFSYQPVWSDSSRDFAYELMKKIAAAKVVADMNVAESTSPGQQSKGFWSYFNISSLMGICNPDDIALEERKKVPSYLTAAMQLFSNIFGINDIPLQSCEQLSNEISMERSSSMNTSRAPASVISQVPNKSINVTYMGDPDLKPIATYENTILIRLFYHLSSRLNEMYSEEMSNLWSRRDFLGYISREILEKPCTIRMYTKGGPNYRNITSHNLPPRLSFRRLASHTFIVWLSIGFVVFRFFGYNGLFYIFTLLSIWMLCVTMKAVTKYIGIVKSEHMD